MNEPKKIPPKSDSATNKSPNVKKVTAGNVSLKKKTTGQKIFETFIPGDIKSIGKFLWKEIAIPAVKRALDELISQGGHMLLYPGDTSHPSRTRPGEIRASYDYNRQYRSPSRDYDRPRSYINKWADDFNLDRVSFSSRVDAEMVLRSMEEQLRDYPFVRVSDFFEYAVITSDNYQATNWGWTSLREAYVETDFNGEYYIKFPKIMPID